MADLVPRTRGAEKPRVFLWEAAAAAVRVVGSADSPWFVAKDVCAVLDIERTDSALRGLEEDEKGAHTVSTLGGPQELSTVNESGLYALIFRSRKEQARIFRKWVTSEVLPQIRKTGAYAPAALPPPREIVVHQTFRLPTPASGPEDLLIELVMEVMRATDSRRHSCIVHGHTIADIARRDGSFSEWFGRHDDYQANARFFKNLSQWFGRPLYRTFRAHGYDEPASAIVYTIQPQGHGRHRRYILSSRQEDMPNGHRAVVPPPAAVQIVAQALSQGGEVLVK